MSTWFILIIIILVVLIIWWALLRNAKGYQPDFPLHHDEGHAEHGDEAETATRGALETDEPHDVDEMEVPVLRAHAAQVEATEPGSESMVTEMPLTPAAATMDEAQPYEAAQAIAAEEPVQPLAPPAPRAAMPGVEEGAPVEPAGQASEHPAAAPQAPHTSSPETQPDDLIIIEGIGPKVNQVLQAAGIYTFAQLAETSVEQLKAILAPAGFRYMDPGTWPEQARLAGEGKMAELEAYQKSLNAGRSNTL